MLNHQQTSPDPTQPKRAKIPRVVQYSPLTSTMVIEGINGIQQEYDYEDQNVKISKMEKLPFPKPPDGMPKNCHF